MRIVLIVPCYNEEDRWDAFYRSIQAQTVKVEIIAMDDGSKDGTLKKLRSSNILHVGVNERNLGITKTFNRLIEAAKIYNPDYLTWGGVDEELYPDAIERRLKHLQETDCDIVVTGADAQTRDYKINYPEMLPQFEGLRSADFDNLYYELLSRNFLPTPFLLDMRRVSFDALPYDTRFKHFPDWEQYLRLARRYRFAYLDQSTGCSDWNGTNFSAPNPAFYREKLRELRVILWEQTKLAKPQQFILFRVLFFLSILRRALYRLLRVNTLRLLGARVRK